MPKPKHLRWRDSFALIGLAAAGHAVAIVGGTSTTAFGQVDSGVQFSDNWVLTARHVGYAVGGTYGNGFGSATIAARYDLPGPGFPQNDLALLRLATPIAIPALALEATLLPPGVLATPIDVTITTGANQVPRGYAFTQLREVLDSVDPDDAGPLPAVPVNWLVTYTDGFGPPYVEGGDSGGGLFLAHVTDSTTPLLGITSASITDTTVDPVAHASGFVQLAAYRSWIDGTMAADLADNQQALWVSSVPEPASVLMWLGGLALLVPGACRQRGRVLAR